MTFFKSSTNFTYPVRPLTSSPAFGFGVRRRANAAAALAALGAALLATPDANAGLDEPIDTLYCYQDADRDGYYNPNARIYSVSRNFCLGSYIFPVKGSGPDCNDNDPTIHPRTRDRAGDVDEDCNWVSPETIIWPDYDYRTGLVNTADSFYLRLLLSDSSLATNPDAVVEACWIPLSDSSFMHCFETKIVRFSGMNLVKFPNMPSETVFVVGVSIYVDVWDPVQGYQRVWKEANGVPFYTATENAAYWAQCVFRPS